jgi:hypothetical protein
MKISVAEFTKDPDKVFKDIAENDTEVKMFCGSTVSSVVLVPSDKYREMIQELGILRIAVGADELVHGEEVDVGKIRRKFEAIKNESLRIKKEEDERLGQK